MIITRIKQRLVHLKDVSLSYGSNRVLEKVSLDINTNEIITIIGPNGAGKSSLIKIIAGLNQDHGGIIEKNKGLSVGYVPQKLSMDKSLPIKVSRFLSLAKAPKTKYKDALAQVGAAHLWSKQMHELSGGEFQRVLLARAISREPQLLLLDEPLQGVDVNGQVELYRLISEIRDNLHCGIVMVSHDLHLVMAQTDRVICLNQHICCEGQPESVSQHPEYLSLFGPRAGQDIAVYTHNHDHHHTLHGDVVECNEGCKHD